MLSAQELERLKVMAQNGFYIDSEGNVINIVDSKTPILHVCHDGDTSPNDGEKFENTMGANLYTFGIKGTSTAQVYEFRGVDEAGNDSLITCFRATDYVKGTGTSVKGETWRAPLTGLVRFYVKATTLSGGTSIVRGRITKDN